jgi:hypothetical protein
VCVCLCVYRVLDVLVGVMIEQLGVGGEVKCSDAWG